MNTLPKREEADTTRTGFRIGTGTGWEELDAFLARSGLSAGKRRTLHELEALRSHLQRINRAHNLTRLTSLSEFWIRHVADSLALGFAVPEILHAEWRLADVGCGAGFPGLVLAWANPQLHVTGIERQRRKAAFAAAASERLDLPNFETVCEQVQEVARKAPHRNAYDLVLLRAVGTPARFVRVCRHLLQSRPAGRLVFYMTPASVTASRALGLREAGKYGLKMTESPVLTLPGQAGERQFLIFRAATEESAGADPQHG